jgi:hypothetical protein
MEARVRIELTYKGFADLSLTTWVPRLFSSKDFQLLSHYAGTHLIHLDLRRFRGKLKQAMLPISPASL